MQTDGKIEMRVRLNIILVFICVVLISNSGFSQIFPVLGAQRMEDNLVFFPQGYMLPNLSGYGYSKTISDVCNIGNMNPASISSFDKISGGFSYQYDSKIDEAWIVDLGYVKNKYGVPQSAGFVYPYRDFRFGIGFNQKFNQSIIWQPIPVTTEYQPEGTGEYISITNDYNVMSYSFTAAWSAHNAFTKKDYLSFGARYDLNMLNIYEEIGAITGKGRFYNSGYALGVTYAGMPENDYSYTISLFFEKGANMSGELNFSGGGIQTVTSLDSTRTSSANFAQYTTVGKIPDRINYGIDLHVSKPLRISTNLTWVLWHNISTSENQPELTISALYNYSELVSFSFGTYFIRYIIPNIPSNFGVSDNLNAVYFTAGTVVHYSMADINLGIADSHLMSGKWRKQTVGMVSLGFHL